jgi:NADH-quinone oxidoreductase subunit J
MIGIAFIIIAVVTLVAGLAAALMSRLIHAALSLVVAFGGLAAFYFLLGAEFVGLVQVFVYVGAVAVLIVFTILLTRREVKTERGFNWTGVLIAVAVLAALLWAIFRTPELAVAAPEPKTISVKEIGSALMNDYVWPLQCVGLVLTAALIGALVLVTEKESS